MPAFITHCLEALCQPFRVERDAQERRQRLTGEALRSLPDQTTDAEKVHATGAIRDALQPFDCSANVMEMRVAIEKALKPVRDAVRKRVLCQELIAGAARRLPFWLRTEQDESCLRRNCTKILAELPTDFTEAEGKAAIEPTIQQACGQIEKRKADQDRQARKASLIQQGIDEIFIYLLKLKGEDEIISEDVFGTKLNDQLKTIVRSRLQAELSGDEPTEKVKGLVHGIVDEERE
jgi:hypothetical protein